jgi:hypothetical protein
MSDGFFASFIMMCTLRIVAAIEHQNGLVTSVLMGIAFLLFVISRAMEIR